MHGDQSQQAEYRAATLEYMRAHATHFKSFIAVHPGGGLRRNAKRKNRSDLGKHLETAAVTADEVDAAFQRYLKVMEKGGAYGDNLEIIAFANTYKVNVRIYSEEMKQFLDVQCDDDSAEEAKTAYIAHHVSLASG